MKKALTIKDIAKEAKVSTSTVSHVINSTRKVEPKTRDRVIKVIRKLNYRPNVFAQGLRGKPTKTIGVIISDIREDFFSEVTKSIETTAGIRGYGVLLCDAEEDPEKEASYLSMLIDKKVDGIIIAPVDPRSESAEVRESKIPLIQVDRKSVHLEGCFVGIDNEACAQVAASHLLEHGYRSIGFIGYRSIFTMGERRKGFYKAMEAGRRADSPLCPKELLIDSRDRAPEMAIRNWLLANKDIEALLCGNSTITYNVLLATEALKLRMPEDVALISFDDTIWFRFLKPSVTAIRQPTAELGTTAINLLLDQQRLEGTAPTQGDRLIKADFVIRESCGKHPTTRAQVEGSETSRKVAQVFPPGR